MNNYRVALIGVFIILSLVCFSAVLYFIMNDDNRNVNHVEKTQESIGLARKLLANKEYQASIDLLNQMIANEDVDPEVYRLLYVSSSLKGDDDIARNAIVKYLESKPALSKYWLDYLDLEKKIGADTQKVYDIYAMAIDDVSRNTNKTELVNVYRSYATYLSATGLYDEAIRYLRLAQSIDVANADFYDEQVQFVVSEKLKAQQ